MIKNSSVASKFASYPKAVRPKMQQLRALILDVAACNKEIGAIEETLKWGEPAYLTSETKSGTTIRIDWKPKCPEQYALYVNCQTTLVDTFRSLYPTELVYEGNRAIIFALDAPIPEEAVRQCIRMALRYHLDKAPR